MFVQLRCQLDLGGRMSYHARKETELGPESALSLAATARAEEACRGILVRTRLRELPERLRQPQRLNLELIGAAPIRNRFLRHSILSHQNIIKISDVHRNRAGST